MIVARQSQSAVFFRAVVAILMLPVWLYATTSVAISEEAANKLSPNFRFVESLILESQGAQGVAASNNSEAQALHQQAKQLLEDAKQAQKKGDLQAADAALRKARTVMFDAIRLVGAGVKKQKKQQDFTRRYDSVNALLEAHQQYSREKQLGQPALDTESYVKDKMQQAKAAEKKGDMAASLELIENAYVTIKLSLTKFRSGETVVRSLNFANAEEEYRYELDRNDTHKMLVDMLLREKLAADQRLKYLINLNMKQAEDLRTQAEQAAGQQDFKAGIKHLEESTSQIIRAIRAAGIYIPG